MPIINSAKFVWWLMVIFVIGNIADVEIIEDQRLNLTVYKNWNNIQQLFWDSKHSSYIVSYRVSPIVNQTYGYPDGIGGLIIETPFNYPNGPSAWTPNNTWGAYGIIIAPGSWSKSSGCEPIPDTSPFVNSSMQPVRINKENACMIGCNMTMVSNGESDPCNIGSITLPSDSPMSCWDIGTMAGGYGVCAYNCSALVPDASQLTPCSEGNLQNGTCGLYCNTATFPN